MEKKEFKELNEEQLKNVAGGVSYDKGTQDNNCFNNCLKEQEQAHLGRSFESDKAFCEQRCSTKMGI